MVQNSNRSAVLPCEHYVIIAVCNVEVACENNGVVSCDHVLAVLIVSVMYSIITLRVSWIT